MSCMNCNWYAGSDYGMELLVGGLLAWEFDV